MRIAFPLLGIGAALLCAGCGPPAGGYETAGLEVRSSGGDEVISEEGIGVGTDSGPSLAAPVPTRDAYREALERARIRRQRELGQADSEGPAAERLREELRAIETKLGSLDSTFLQQRQYFVVADGALDTFVTNYAPERRWEVRYAMRAGDIGLAASIVQDVLRRVREERPAPILHVDVAQEATVLDGDTDAPIQDMARSALKAETRGADALLKLAELAIESADYAEAERQFRACLNYEADLGVKTDALTGYAALLELLERDEEAARVDRIAARMLNLER